MSWLQCGKRARSVVPGIEVLEERCVPATYPALPPNLGTPTAWGALPGGPSQYVAQVQGDFNGDGRTDVAGLTSDGTWYVGVSLRDHFAASVWATSWRPVSRWVTIQVGDFNGDGKDDVAGLQSNGQWVVGLSTGRSFLGGHWASAWFPGLSWQTFQVGDFNGDGRDDVAGFDFQGKWHLGVSTGSGFRTTVYQGGWAAGHVWQAFVVGDFQDDGAVQIAALHQSGQWRLLTWNGQGFGSAIWSSGGISQPAPSTVQVGDFDGDGKDDVVAFYDPGLWFEFRSTGSSFQVVNGPAGWAGPVDWVSFQTGDFLGNGMDQVAALSVSGGVWLLQGPFPDSYTDRWDYRPLYLPGSTFTGLQAGDVNGDGREDLLFRRGDGQYFAGLSTGSSFVFGAPSGAFYFIAPWDLREINHPDTFGDLFQRYAPLIRKALGPTFATLTDEGVALVLATEVAYEHASYRGDHDPQGVFPAPNSLDVNSLLAVPKLVCNEYCYLAYGLFRKWLPAQGDTSGTKIALVGWNDGVVGNHAQLAVTGVGVPLLLDPTSGLIAITNLGSLQRGVAVPASDIADLSVRVEATAFMEHSLSTGRARIHLALEAGLYKESVSLYDTNLDTVFSRL